MSNRFLNTASCVDNLYREYLLHPKLIIAIDFDCTVFDYKQTGDTYEVALNLAKRCQDLGFYIVCYTHRSPESYGFIHTYFAEHGITLDAINRNVVIVGDSKVPETKIYYNILLDDKAGLGQAQEILESLLNKIENK